MGTIVFISQFFHPLEVPCINGYARALQEWGFDVTVVASRVDTSWPSHDSYEGVSVLRVDPLSGRLGRVRYIVRLLRTIRGLSRPALVIGNFLDIHGAAAILAGWSRGVPAVIIEHGSGVYEAHTWHFRDRVFNRFCLRFARLIIALSQEDKARLAASRARGRVDVVPCPLFPLRWDESKDSSRRAQGWPPSEHHLVIAGRLVKVGGIEQKGVSVAIEAMTALTDCRLHVLGDGELRPRLEELARTRGVADRVSFHGRVPRELVHQCMNAADVVLVPSAYEPLGMVVLEAMALRTPLVVTAVGGPRDYVRPDVDGLVIEPGNSAALAAAVASLLASPALRARLTANAAERVVECFTPAVVIGRFLSTLVSSGLAGHLRPLAPQPPS
jgi:glycosyltransferase involved in cell wall biosynthesis